MPLLHSGIWNTSFFMVLLGISVTRPAWTPCWTEMLMAEAITQGCGLNLCMGQLIKSWTCESLPTQNILWICKFGCCVPFSCGSNKANSEWVCPPGSGIRDRCNRAPSLKTSDPTKGKAASIQSVYSRQAKEKHAHMCLFRGSLLMSWYCNECFQKHLQVH